MLLIGYPWSGIASVWFQSSKAISTNPLSRARARAGDGHGRQGPFLVTGGATCLGSAVGRDGEAIPSLVFTGTGSNIGDITGKQGRAGTGTGTGHGSATLYQVKVGPRGGVKRKIISKRKGTGKRPVKSGRAVGSPLFGDGQGGLYSASRDYPLFEDRRDWEQWMQGCVKVTDSFAERIQAIGLQAARKQASLISQRRSVTPSDTSIQDAASDAVLSLLTHMRKLDTLPAAAWDSKRLRKVVWMYAARGAWHSLASWAGLGMTGDNSKRKGDLVTSLTTDLVEQMAINYPAPWDESDTVKLTRFQMLRWVYKVGYREFISGMGTGTGSAAAKRAARMRVQAVGQVIMGNTLEESCGWAGYASTKVFKQSCQESGFWSALSRARREDSSAVVHRGWMRFYSLQAAQAIKTMRALSIPWDVNTSTFGGNRTHKVSKVLAWRKAARARASAIELAKHHRDAWQGGVKADMDAFNRVLVGMKDGRMFGNLRTLAGLTAKRKGHGGGVHASMISTAKGKVTRKAVDVSQALQVGRVSSKGKAKVLPCAPLAGTIKPIHAQPDYIPGETVKMLPASILGRPSVKLPGGGVMFV